METTDGKKGPPWPQWRDRFFSENRKTVRSLSGRLGRYRNLWEARERAITRHDPSLAPHGFFRSLASGKNEQAKEFLETFGPLHIPRSTRDDPLLQIEINLAEFWTWHLRFRLVAQLWEARHEKHALLGRWDELGQCIERASSVGELPLGCSRISEVEYLHFVLPWARRELTFTDWANQTPLTTLRDEAIRVVQSELNLHYHTSKLSWARGWEPSGEKFRLEHWPGSLWSMIWEFFAWDTAGVAWRRCPHCEVFFYPKRKDQLYCTSRQQGLASKRDYAKRKRAEEKKSKRRKQ